MIEKVGMIVRYNVFGYLLGEGFHNVLKNKKSTISSIIIMFATMIIFGMVFTIGENLNHVMEDIETQQGFEVFIKDGATEEQITALGEFIKKIDGVNTTQFVTKEDALNKMKSQFKDKQFLATSYDELNPFPPSYIVTLSDLSKNQEIQATIREQQEVVDDIRSSDQTIDTLLSIANGIRIASAFISALLILISIFIIANTIKLSLHARRKEISIMKYVGATNSFIRWPFIIEGIIIGVVAAVISTLVLGGLYSVVTTKILESSVMGVMNITLLNFSDIVNSVILVYLVLGIGIGTIGSCISMRKYLEV